MPVNILSTFILGSALAWIVIKITRPPKNLEGLILGCCSAGIFILCTNKLILEVEAKHGICVKLRLLTY